MGCVSQVGEQALNVGRVALLVAGWPETVCAATTDRQCGSSMQAAFNATAAVQAGHLDVVVAAGVENMSRVPMGSNLGPDGFAGFSEKLFERWEIVPQGISAEVLAEEWNLSRDALDAYSYESHRRAIEAIDEGRFESEIVPDRGLQPTRRHVVRGRRDAAAGHVTREARRARPGVQAGRRGHGGQLEPDLRRLGGHAPRLGGCRRAARARAAGAVRVLRPRRRRPLPHAPRQPAGVRAGACEGRPVLGRHGGDRGQRGVRVGRAPVPGRHGPRGALAAPAT